MSEELFEKYFQNTLTPVESEALKKILRAEGEGREAFIRYMQERSILVQLTGRKSGEMDLPARKPARRRTPAARRSPWMPVGIAAAILFVFVLGLVILPSNPIPAPVATNEDPPAPAPEPKSEPAPNTEPDAATPEPPKPRLVRVPTPVPTPPRNIREEAKPVLPEPLRPALVKKPEPASGKRPEPKTVPAIASLVRTTGGVFIADAQGRQGQPILAGQSIETRGPHSAATLRFPDGTHVVLDSETTLREVSETNQRNGGKRIYLATGALTADVAKQAAGAPMIFTTPQGKATVLGTTLRLSVDAGNSTRLEVTEGRVRLTRNDGRSVLVRADFFAVAAPGAPLAAKRLAVRPVAAFDVMPKWSDAHDADWGGKATWQLGPGITGRGLRVSRKGEGSSVRVMVFAVPPNASIELSSFIRCPESQGDYWVEVGYRLGGHTAADFDTRPQSWAVIKKFDAASEKGNNDRWVRYAAKADTGTFRQITVGFKLGSRGGGSPVVGWDDIRITSP